MGGETEMNTTEQQLREQIRQIARGGQAPCRALLDLAARTGTPPREVGRLCDEMNVRISNCQLGCFGGE